MPDLTQTGLGWRKEGGRERAGKQAMVNGIGEGRVNVEAWDRED